MTYTFQFGEALQDLPYLLAGAAVSLQIAFIAFWSADAFFLSSATRACSAFASSASIASIFAFAAASSASKTAGSDDDSDDGPASVF